MEGMRHFLLIIVGILMVAAVFFGTRIALTTRDIVERYSASVAAVITNDSTSIDLEGFDLGAGSSSDTSGAGVESANPNASGTTNEDAGIGGAPPTSSESAVTDVIITSVSGSSPSEPQSSSSQSETANQSGTSSQTQTTESATDFLATLIGNQAVSVSGTLSGSGVSSGAGVLVRVDGNAVRSALRARGITEVSLSSRTARGKLIGRLTSKEDFTLLAASRALSNASIDEVVLSSGTLSVSYRSQGRLFAVIPLNFSVKVSVNPLLDTPEKRVAVRFPWYKFFLQTFVSKKSLQKDLDEAIDDIREEEKITIDTEARLFGIIVQTLERRFDTVEGSIQKK